MADDFEQLSLDLPLTAADRPGRGRPRRLRPRRPQHPVVSGLRLLVAVLLALTLASVAIMIAPYRTTVAGVDLVVTGTVQPGHRGLSVDSSLGSLQFRDVTAVPIGLHVAPQVDLGTVRAVTGTDDFATSARSDLEDRVPSIALHFGLAALFGLLLGALIGRLLVDGAVLLIVRDPVQRSPRREGLRHAAVQVVAVTVALASVAALTGAVTYRSDWLRRYTVTGLLADVVATPDRLAALDARDSSAAAKIRAVLRLQDALTQPAATATASDTAYSILFVSDVHRRNIYPYLRQYIAANDVALIVNTGDETLVGNAAELTPDYTASIQAITATTPMLWVKGNHDSAAVAARMAAVPGVTVLDGDVVTADGLQIYGTADPRTYGAPGAAGSDDPATVTRIETGAAATALSQLDRRTYLDLLLAHEPVEADALSDTLGATVRAQASGHVHHQNAESDLQHGDHLRLVEGTTGLGGLLADAGDPMSFSVMSVAPDCQFTRIVRYQLADPALPADSEATAFGENSSFVVHYFDRQAMTPDRTCSADAGVGAPVPATSSQGLATLSQWGPAGAVAPTRTAVSTPAPVSGADESGDAQVTRSPDAAPTS